ERRSSWRDTQDLPITLSYAAKSRRMPLDRLDSTSLVLLRSDDHFASEKSRSDFDEQTVPYVLPRPLGSPYSSPLLPVAAPHGMFGLSIEPPDTHHGDGGVLGNPCAQYWSVDYPSG